MSIFYSKDVKEAIRRTREEERAKAAADRLDVIAEMSALSEKKIDATIKFKDAEKASAMKGKDAEIRALQAIIDDKNKSFKTFRRDLDNMETLASEMSALGMAIENMTGGITGKFHGFKTRISLIQYSVEKKERKYKEILEK